MDNKTLNDKSDLIQWLSTLEDESVILKLKKIRDEELHHWWKDISDSEQNSISDGIE